ncbi:MAG TPA: wax ester/triacylglycerol synthase family O-acyltransferase [Kofleriaceae bacterium]|nr:wax ester/triacylglycerol synthase family O-acyltransferase [Kofleriaceae bacterium]
MAPPERLSALDAAFLSLESDRVPFVIGAVLGFAGRLELERVRGHVESALDRLPRYRQRIARMPLLRHPVWIDDPSFSIDRHVLELDAPPLGPRELDAVAARLVAAGPPRREHPPWQLWLVPLEGERSAIIGVAHHALVDGVAGMHVIAHILRAMPDQEIPPRRPQEPAPAPPRWRLLRCELAHRAAGLRQVRTRLPEDPGPLAGAVARLLVEALRRASDAGINPRQNAPERLVSTAAAVDLAAVKAVKSAFGGTVNDVVLAVVTGALRRFLARRGADPDALGDLRAMVPASTSRPGDQSVAGNKVSLLLARLPVDEPDPVRRLERTIEATRDLKGASAEAQAGDLLVQLADVSSPALLAGVLRVALWRGAFNLVVTNIPGPPLTLYLDGVPLESIVPIVNLWPHGGLGIAVLSYRGKLRFGLNADRALIHDLDPLVADIAVSFDELERAVAARAARAAPPDDVHPPL